MSDQNRWLSNFYPYKKDGTLYPHKLSILSNGIVFDCVECAYQASKTLDKDTQILISKMNPYEAKEYSLTKGIEQEDWTPDLKLKVMEELVSQKFKNHEPLKQMLLETKDILLEEGNTWGDTFWGKDLETGLGENHLGKIIMKVRAKIQNPGQK